MIDKLKEEGHLPSAVVAWAHTIRQLGSKAAHEFGRPTPEEAKEVVEFTKVILKLLYSYPARIKRLKR